MKRILRAIVVIGLSTISVPLAVGQAIPLPLPPTETLKPEEPKPETQEREAARHFRVAQEAMKAKDYTVAVEELSECVKLVSSNALAHYNLAVALTEQNRFSEAMNSLDRVQSLGIPDAIKDESEELRAKITYRLKAKPTAAKADAERQGEGPSISETLSFIQKKLDGRSSPLFSSPPKGDCNGHYEQTFTYHVASNSSCSLTFQERQRKTAWAGDFQCYFSNFVVRDANRDALIPTAFKADIIAEDSTDAFVVQLKDLSIGDIKSQAGNQPAFYHVALEFTSPMAVSTTGSKTGWHKRCCGDEDYRRTVGISNSYLTKSYSIEVGDQDLADRLAQAFKRAAELCGAKKDVF